MRRGPGSDGVFRPTPQQLRAAVKRRVPDLIRPGLQVLFCGINPGLYSAAVRHHFARPGNRFWPALHAAGFTPRLLSPFEEHELLDRGYGITNFVDRASAAAGHLSPEVLIAGAAALGAKIRRYQPAWAAFLGLGAYRTGFDRPRAVIGPQPQTIGSTSLWVLPNPSGLNAHYTPADFAALFSKLHAAAEAGASSDRAPG
jgi:TDG/mug DNA glycosylase family protein